MRITVRTLGFALLASSLAPSVASARETSLLSAATATATQAPQKEDIRVLGRLNANVATRDELLQVPGIEATKVDEILEARAQGALSSLDRFGLAPDVLSRLSLEGRSTLRRIRVLPLETFAQSPKSATR